MRDGIFGLLVALVLVASVSIGLSFKPEAATDLWIDFFILAAACLAVASVVFRGLVCVYAVFICVCCIGIAWGGHAVTRESFGNTRSFVGADQVLIHFQACLLENFKQPDIGEEDLLDSFQKAVEPPRYRALAEIIETKNSDGVTACNGTVTLFIDGNGSEFSVGDEVAGVGWLRGLEAPHNPGEPDFRIRAFRNNHAGNISVAGNLKIITKTSFTNNLFTFIREQSCAWVDHNLLSVMNGIAPPQIQTLVVAMTTGRQLPGYRALRQSFSGSGLSHFLAISGFNLAILFGAVWVCMELFHFPWVFRGWFLVVTAFLFLFVVDVETSVLRAGIAGILVGVSVACDRGWRADGLLAVAVIFTLVCDPWAAWNPGFQLSYGAVLALRYGSDPILRMMMRCLKFFPSLSKTTSLHFVKSIATAFSASVAAWLMSTPITESHFGSISIWAAVASTVLAPLAAIITVLASTACVIGSLPGAEYILGYALTFFSELFLWLSNFVGLLPASNIRGGAIPWWWAVIELIALAGCWVCVTPRIRHFSMVLFLILFVASVFFPVSKADTSSVGWKLRMTSISVGDGSAHVVETPNSCVLFDAGTISRHAGGSKLIVPALKAIGCTRFNAVFISHPHLDPFSALPAIAGAFQIDRVYATEAFITYMNTEYAPGVLMNVLKKFGLTIEPFTAGNSVSFDGFVWTALHPKIGYRSRIVNDGSLVFRIEPEKNFQIYSENKIPVVAWLMVCGDSQTEAIANILASPHFGPSLVMELPHHGAWSDGVVDLVPALKPWILIQSTGYQRFQFDRIEPVVHGYVRGVTCRDSALRVTWFENELDGLITNQVLLERWVGDGWVEVTSRTNQK